MKIEIDDNLMDTSINSFNQLTLKTDQQVVIGEINDSNVNVILEKLPSLVSDFNSNDLNFVIQSTTIFRKLLSIEKSPPIDQIINTGIVPRLVRLLYTQESPLLQFEAAWVLTNIASGTPDNTMVVIEHGGVQAFVSVLNSTYNDDVREQSIWGLGNIAGNSAHCRDLALNQNALQPIVNLLQNSESLKLSIARNATWSLANLFRGKPQPPFEIIRPALPVLSKLIHHKDIEVIIDSCWAFSYISECTNEGIQEIINANGVCQRLVQLLSHPETTIQTPALRTIGNIVFGDEYQTQYILDLNPIPSLMNLLKSTKSTTRKEVCWTFSNILACGQNQIQQLLDAGIVPPLIQLLINDEPDIKREITCAILNISLGSPQHIKYLVDQMGCIKSLFELIVSNCARTVNFALRTIDNILVAGKTEQSISGINPFINLIKQLDNGTITRLQYHTNKEISDHCKNILILLK